MEQGLGCVSSGMDVAPLDPRLDARMPDVAFAADGLIRITESIGAGDPEGREGLFELAVNGQAD